MKNAMFEFNGVKYVESESSCPVHGGSVKKVYDFGKGDSEVIVFDGCSCALCADCERSWYIAAELKENGFDGSGASYHVSYAAASGKAKLVHAINAAW